MDNKEFLCSLYNKELVERAIEYSKEAYLEHEAEILYKLAVAEDMLPDRTGGSEIYRQIQHLLTLSYLHGACYAASQSLSSNDTSPSEDTFSEFHKNVDFAVLFDFSDNDFGLAMEAAARTYCRVFNEKLHQIDMYDGNDFMNNRHIEEFATICKTENIKEIMKYGFLAQRMQKGAEECCRRIPNAVSELECIKSELEYIPWDEDKESWEEVDGNYIKSKETPRFITGTNAEIAEALKKYGDPSESQDSEFPVWCNGEVVILYMKNGYLTYLIR